MFAIAFVLLLICQSPADRRDQANGSVDGIWHVIGNEHHGTLELKVESDNTLTGKIYDQTIKGKWNPNDKRFEFTRYQLDKGIQVWEGELKANPQDPNGPRMMSGKFFSIAGPSFGENDKKYDWTGRRLGKDGLYVGMPAPASIVAEFVSGEKADKRMCPVLRNHEETKIAIFSKQFNAPVLALMKLADGIVAGTPELKSSFAFVSHENAPTPTVTEFDDQLSEIRREATENSIKHLSIGLMIRIPDNQKNTRAKPSLGFFGDGDIVVMLISPEKGHHHAIVRYFQVLQSETAAGEIERVCNELRSTFAELEK